MARAGQWFRVAQQVSLAGKTIELLMQDPLPPMPPGGYYVVEVTKITPGTHKSLAQERSQIRQTLVGLQQQTAQTTVDNTAKKHWLSQTKCRGAYAMADCTGYKAPKTSTSTTPTP